MNVETVQDRLIEAFQEREKLLMAIVGLAPGEDRAGGDIKSGKDSWFRTGLSRG
jgi:hypothetical protein